MKSMQIRKINGETEIRNVLQECGPYLYNKSMNDVKVLNVLSIKYAKAATVFLVRDMERTAGLIAFYSNDNVNKKGFISMIVVHGNYQRMGLGKMLLEAAIQKCRQCGMKEVQLEVDRSNLHAISFYERNGFSRVCETDNQSYIFGIAI